MIKHQYFDLQILEDHEVATILKTEITKRETIAQWPLSCVEKITCADGSEWIVKSNHQPCDIEGHFYEQVSSPFVIKPQYIHSSSPYQTIIYRYIKGLSYSVVNLNKKYETERCFRDDFQPMLASINQPELPVYLKIDTETDFLSTFKTLISRLLSLVENGNFTSVTNLDIDTLSTIIDSQLTIDLAMANTGLVHGDFTVDNILCSNNTGKIVFIDWQRPIYGSPLIDEYSFVKSRKFDPDPPAMVMGSLVQLNWLADCALNWFPEGCNTYSHQTKEQLTALIKAYQTLNTNQIKM